MRTTVATLAVATLMIFATSAQAAPTLVNVRIEGKNETLFEGPILTEGHEVKASSDTQERPCDGINSLDPQNKTPGATPTAASADAMSLIGETFDGQWYPGYDDYFITRWGPDEQDPAEGAYWGILVNDVFTNVGGCQYELHENDEVLWVYDAFKERANLALFPAGDTASRPPLTAIAQLGQPFGLQVEVYGDDKEDNPPTEPDRADATPYKGAEVSPVLTSSKGLEQVQTTSPEVVTTSSEGKASITFTTPGWHRIKAGTPLGKEGEEEAVRSNRIDVCVPAPGETGCGPQPAEDESRTPAGLAVEPEEEHHETPLETHETPTQTPGGGNQLGGQAGNGSLVTPLVTSTPTLVPQRSSPTALLTLESFTSRRLLLKLTGSGTATVQIARQAGNKHNLRWQAVKTITVKVTKAGQVEVRLPRLTVGRYRLRIGLAGANSVTRIVSVTRGSG
ncbi:MAG TPA: DUF4430 domain-containing protein [Solirubrobacteraceae bacterium]|jgi:hypothetical protein|nr:DUF4430 domain-containing protein [Solirubrobacteraceae bacterium]